MDNNDYGLDAQLEVLEALTTPGDTENQQLICLLLELKRRRASAILDEAERAELLAYRGSSKKAVAWTDAEELRDANNGGCGYLFPVGGSANNFADPCRQIMLYTTPQLIDDLVETTKPVKRI